MLLFLSYIYVSLFEISEGVAQLESLRWSDVGLTSQHDVNQHEAVYFPVMLFIFKLYLRFFVCN